MIGKKLIIVGADYSDVSIGKLKVALTSSTLKSGEISTLTLSAPSITSPTFSATTESSLITLSGSNPYTITGGSEDGTATIKCTLSYTESGETKTENKNISIKITNTEPVTKYSITTTITNGSYTGATSIVEGGTSTVTISANENYSLPASITVTGATYTYDSTTGIISLSNPTGDVSISGECKEEAGIETWYTNYTSLTNFKTDINISHAGFAYSELGHGTETDGSKMNRLRAIFTKAGTCTIGKVSSSYKVVVDSTTLNITADDLDTLKVFELDKTFVLENGEHFFVVQLGDSCGFKYGSDSTGGKVMWHVGTSSASNISDTTNWAWPFDFGYKS